MNIFDERFLILSGVTGVHMESGERRGITRGAVATRGQVLRLFDCSLDHPRAYHYRCVVPSFCWGIATHYLHVIHGRDFRIERAGHGERRGVYKIEDIDIMLHAERAMGDLITMALSLPTSELVKYLGEDSCVELRTLCAARFGGVV